MSVCAYCGIEMTKTTTCIKPLLIAKSRNGSYSVYKRDAKYFDTDKRCHDCGIENKPGNIHHLGCDMERCPKCGEQLISCVCFKSGMAVSFGEEFKGTQTKSWLRFTLGDYRRRIEG